MVVKKKSNKFMGVATNGIAIETAKRLLLPIFVLYSINISILLHHHYTTSGSYHTHPKPRTPFQNYTHTSQPLLLHPYPYLASTHKIHFTRDSPKLNLPNIHLTYTHFSQPLPITNRFILAIDTTRNQWNHSPHMAL